MKKTDLKDSILCTAVHEMESGLIDVDLGGNVVKKRVSMPGRGKSRSARTLLATNFKSKWFFIFGFEKNQRVNISKSELDALQMLSSDLLSLNPSQIDLAKKDGVLLEICNES